MHLVTVSDLYSQNNYIRRRHATQADIDNLITLLEERKRGKRRMTKLVGYRKFASSKNGKEYCVAQVVSDVTEREANRGFVGQKVEELFLPEDQIDVFKPTDIGKEIETTYELSGGRAYLVKVSVASNE